MIVFCSVTLVSHLIDMERGTWNTPSYIFPCFQILQLPVRREKALAPSSPSSPCSSPPSAISYSDPRAAPQELTTPNLFEIFLVSIVSKYFVWNRELQGPVISHCQLLQYRLPPMQAQLYQQINIDTDDFGLIFHKFCILKFPPATTTTAASSSSAGISCFQ